MGVDAESAVGLLGLLLFIDLMRVFLKKIQRKNLLKDIFSGCNANSGFRFRAQKTKETETLNKSYLFSAFNKHHFNEYLSW